MFGTATAVGFPRLPLAGVSPCPVGSLIACSMLALCLPFPCPCGVVCNRVPAGGECWCFDAVGWHLCTCFAPLLILLVDCGASVRSSSAVGVWLCCSAGVLCLHWLRCNRLLRTGCRVAIRLPKGVAMLHGLRRVSGCPCMRVSPRGVWLVNVWHGHCSWRTEPASGCGVPVPRGISNCMLYAGPLFAFSMSPWGRVPPWSGRP